MYELERWWYALWAYLDAQLQRFEDWLPPTVNLLEIAWFLPAVYGLLRYLGRTVGAVRFLWRLRVNRINGEVQHKAKERVVRFGFLTASFGAFLLAALMAFRIPTATTAPTVELTILTICLFSVQIFLILKGETLDRMDAEMLRLVRARRLREATLARAVEVARQDALNERDQAVDQMTRQRDEAHRRLERQAESEG